MLLDVVWGKSLKRGARKRLTGENKNLKES
jgi:hypothetical protein